MASLEVVLPAVWISLKVAGLATVFAMVWGGGLAYVVVRYRFWGKFWLEAIATLPLVMPPTVVGFFLLQVLSTQNFLGKWLEQSFGIRLIFSWQGATIAAAVMAFPLMFKTTKAALQSVDPIFLEAAATLGQPEWAIASKIWIPLASRGILAGILLSFTRALGEFGATLMVAGNIPRVTQTMPMAIYEAVQTGNDSLAMIFVGILTSLSLLSLVMTQYLERRSIVVHHHFLR
ncbi:molybdate ABC transporter, inner membrane subunit [[Leptolyngbya] sp. PCC 7376]|uniref:molybdate ABC transporter permease subunit n=1 Tax=[Leptolyngbya] sp. PCC 7376 TaxID=111781 RepID=UPI00029EDE2C|nr:molybdate ABC transporter permease subunit [[Leptolyngbya] sp. PCC 7376]AFY40039.1 molybdate ABC transporter, inner membrane subunit [[Leptolyngbya] sp. PCC 7376]